MKIGNDSKVVVLKKVNLILLKVEKHIVSFTAVKARIFGTVIVHLNSISNNTKHLKVNENPGLNRNFVNLKGIVDL